MLSLTTVGRETSPVPTTQVLCDYLCLGAPAFRDTGAAATGPVRLEVVDRWELLCFVDVREFFNGSTSLLGAKELWRIKAPPHVKLFFWLTLHSRLWTAVCRKRHGLQDSDECALCSQEPGMRGHMILGCAFARQVWFAMLRPLQLTSLMPSAEDDNVGVWWLRQRCRVDLASRPLFDSLLLLVAWSVPSQQLQGFWETTLNSARCCSGGVQGRRGLGHGWLRTDVCVS